MASFQCFVSYVQQAAQNSNFGIMSRADLHRSLEQNGMTQAEIDGAIEALNELFKARVRQAYGRSLNPRQKALVGSVYGGGSLNPNQTTMMEQIANVLDVPTISEAEMNNLRQLALLADEREGSEKDLIEEQIRNILHRKDKEYYSQLNVAKVAFKVLWSVGFNVMSFISNKKKVWENYLIQRLRMQKQGKGFFSPYPLADYKQFSNAYANAKSGAIRGVTEDKDFLSGVQATLGLTETALLGTESALQDVSQSSDVLEHTNEKEKGLLGRIKKLDRKMARTSKRWLSSIDTNAKIRLGEVFYFNEIYKRTKANNPAGTPEATILQQVYKNMYSVDYADAVDEAERQFLLWGIVDKNGRVNKNSNRFKVRVAEVMRRGRDPEILRMAYQSAANKVWQGRMTYPSMKGDPYDLTKYQQRLDSGMGGWIADYLNKTRDVVANAVTGTLGENMLTRSLIFSFFGFINGAAAYWQDYMEHNIIFGGAKTLRLQFLLHKDTQNRKLTGPQREYLQDKIIEMKGKVMVGLIETAGIFALMQLAKSLCPPETNSSGERINNAGGFTDFVTPDKPMGEAAAEANSQMQRPESSISFCGKLSIPLEFLGGFSISNVKMISNISDQLENKDQGTLGSIMWGTWLAVQPTISPMMDSNPSVLDRITKAWNDAQKRGTGYDRVWSIAQREFSRAGAEMAVRALPIPNRIMKEVAVVVVPYRNYMPTGIEGSPNAGLANMLWQFGVQSVYSMGNVSGVNQLIQLTTNTEGKIGKPIFDYRHRIVDMGNLYDGKGVQGLTKPFRDAIDLARGKDPILYDEKDHFLAVNDVNIPWDSRIHTRLYKDDPDKTRMLSDDEYYTYTYNYTKMFSRWYDETYPELVGQEKKDIRSTVNRKLLEIKGEVLERLQEMDGKKYEPNKLFEDDDNEW